MMNMLDGDLLQVGKVQDALKLVLDDRFPGVPATQLQ